MKSASSYPIFQKVRHLSFARRSFSKWLRVSIGCSIAVGSFATVNAFSGHAWGQETQTPEIKIPEPKPGDEDFDKAVRLRINVDSVEKLREVIKLGEAALSKGVSPDSETSAKVFLAAAYKQRVELGLRELGQRTASRSRTNKVLGEFVEDLSRSIELDPKVAETYLIKSLILRERQEFAEAISTLDEAIVSFADLLQKDSSNATLRSDLAKLYAARAGLKDDSAEEQLADLEKSVEVNPGDINITKQVVLLLEQQKKFDKIIEVLDRFLEVDPENVDAIASKVRILVGTEKIDEALAFSTKSIESQSDPEAKATLLRQRSLLYQVQNKTDLAKADLDASLELAKDNIQSILQRARLALQMEDLDSAKKDVNQILQIDEENPEATLLRAEISAATEDYDQAIEDYKKLMARFADGSPQKEELSLKLSIAYWQSDKTKQALRLIDQVLRANDSNWQAYRLRGEVLLGTGDHLEAVVSYDKALRLMPDSISPEVKSSLLNNLSWLLATSPDDDVRDGARSVELGKEACELTHFEAPHILSTLAAAYAESGDFEKAIEYSTKAVDLGRKNSNEQVSQLEEELKSYQEKKPWRERKESDENKSKPVIPVPPGAGT